MATCTCNDPTCKAARRKKTLNQIVKKALTDALLNTKGAYTANIILEVRGHK
jgi:hypothetical protein